MDNGVRRGTGVWKSRADDTLYSDHQIPQKCRSYVAIRNPIVEAQCTSTSLYLKMIRLLIIWESEYRLVNAKTSSTNPTSTIVRYNCWQIQRIWCRGWPFFLYSSTNPLFVAFNSTICFPSFRFAGWRKEWCDIRLLSCKEIRINSSFSYFVSLNFVNQHWRMAAIDNRLHSIFSLESLNHQIESPKPFRRIAHFGLYVVVTLSSKGKLTMTRNY